MDVASYYRSLTAELESVKDRVRNFIDTNHWLTHGEWRESVLRAMIQDHDWLLGVLQGACPHRSQIVNFVNLGCSIFTRFWDFPPTGGDRNYECWHSYQVENMSAGYFMANVLDFISPDSIARHSKLWFPEDSKEFRLAGARAHAGAPAALPE